MSARRDLRQPAAGAPLAGQDASTGDRLVYAIGDVHGRYDLLRDLLRQIATDSGRRCPQSPPILVFLGDYIDRGRQSAEVVEALIWLRRSQFELRLLKGNHEQAFLHFVDQPEAGADWLRFGGAETLMSYGVEPPPADAPASDLILARDALLQNMPASHTRLIERLHLMAMIGDYAFVHAGVRPGISLLEQSERDLLWIREGFLDADGPFEKVIVHGHSWNDDQPKLLGHRIGLDTGAYSTGVLTAVVLDGCETAFLQAASNRETGAGAEREPASASP